jgi:exodeoxyribonuclease-3
VTPELRAARLARREAALALRPSMSPPGAAPDRLRVASWNLNSLRVRLPAVERFLVHARPDVLCLQETKAATLSVAAMDVFERHGYEVTHAGSGAYNGVAVASRHPIDDVQSSGGFGVETLDREPRVASCLVRGPHPLRAVSIYVPHGRAIGHWHYDYKLAFIDALAEQARSWLEEGHVVLCGDVNIARTDSDVFHPDAFVGSVHVTPREREALGRLLEVGLVDVDVARWGPDARRFTWWNHGLGYERNLGMRLDLIAADAALAERLDSTWIDHAERGAERPSDHAALIADFGLPVEDTTPRTRPTPADR